MTLESRNPTDDELRDEWLREFPHTIRCRSQFYRYTDGVYQPVHEEIISNEICNILESAKHLGVKPTAARVKSVKELARAAIFKDPNLLDCNPEIFAFKNGVFNLKTQQFTEHSPENYVSIVQDYDFDPKATCPSFMSVIRRFDPSTQLLIQEFAGYCTTTRTNLETMLWLYGRPGSGKSTLIRGFEAFLGKYCNDLSPRQLNDRFGRGGIVGRRLVMATEIPNKGIGDTSILKAIVSGETVSVELKYVDPFDYKSLTKVVWAMNSIPTVDFLRDGIGRRVQIIEFPDLPDSDRDPNLVYKIMKEGPGIFNWACKGLVSLRTRGNFIIPESCKLVKGRYLQKAEKYRTPAAILDEFIKAECSIEKRAKSQAQLFGNAVQEYCKENGIQELNTTQISTGLQELGYDKSTQKGRVYYKGLSLISQDK